MSLSVAEMPGGAVDCCASLRVSPSPCMPGKTCRLRTGMDSCNSNLASSMTATAIQSSAHYIATQFIAFCLANRGVIHEWPVLLVSTGAANCWNRSQPQRHGMAVSSNQNNCRGKQRSERSEGNRRKADVFKATENGPCMAGLQKRSGKNGRPWCYCLWQQWSGCRAGAR